MDQEFSSFREWVAQARRSVDGWVASAGVLEGAAAAGDEGRMQPEVKEASGTRRSAALMAAANAGQPTTARILMDHGADASTPCEAAACEDVFPLHLAVAAGSVETATSLVTRGAPLSALDLRWGWTAAEWARAALDADQQRAMTAFLEEAEVFMPAVEAVREGDLETLRAWLDRHPDRVDRSLGDNQRSLLHFATDWPGFWPGAAESIRVLLEAGADVNRTCEGAGTSAAETPLHWAASSNDVAAMEALLAGGAQVDALGGCIANGTPLFLAVIFRHWDAARMLLSHGARYSLALVAAVGDQQRVAEFFDEAGTYGNPHGPMPYWEREIPSQEELDRSFWFACMGNQPDVARLLLQRGATWDHSSPTGKGARQEAQSHGDRAWDDLIK